MEDDSWEVKDGVNIRTINRIKRLYDTSIVTYPAYNEASVGLRSMQKWEEALKENLEKEKEERANEEKDLTKRSLAELRLSIINKKQ